MALKLHDILFADNVALQLSEEELETLGAKVVSDFESDKRSRYEWERKMEKALKMALQVMEEKSFPWPNASNVKFPLITIAALQYHARAYPALINGTRLVKCRILGDDTDGSAGKRASRIEKHMSYQILEEDENWEDQMDKVLITQPIIGCAFKKTYFDSLKGHNVSENIIARDLVVPYYTKSLETAPRISHILYMSKNDIYERVVKGLFSNVELEEKEPLPQEDPLKETRDKSQGMAPPTEESEIRPYEIIEQHLYMDLDGDGYEEPYIVVVHRDSKKVLRIVARFLVTGVEYEGEKVLRITPEHYFTKYPFIPSPDGGFYDLGFGSLLGPLNESINTLINQLIDAGTMSVTGGGFLSRGIKLRGGTMAFQPNEWKPVDTTGDDLRKGIMPLPVREPNQVLFTLLSLLINYGERIGGAVDILVGENPGQNTPAETTRTMAEQGMKIFSGIFKRTYRALKEEFRKEYRLNQVYITERVHLGDLVISPDDYRENGRAIVPAADPNMISDSQKIMQAQMLQSIASPMWGYNMYEVHKRTLHAWGISEPDKLLPDPQGPNAMPPFKPPQVLVEEIKAQGQVQKEQVKGQIVLKKQQGDIQTRMAELQMDLQVNMAKIEELQAKALLELEQADSEQAKIQIAAIDAQIGMMRGQQEHILKTIDLMHTIVQDRKEKQQRGNNKE